MQSDSMLETTLGAICAQQGGSIQTGPFGSQLHASDYTEFGTPVVMPADIIGGRISTDAIARVGDDHVLRLSQHKLQLNDIVFSRRGDVTRFARVTEREVGWLCGTGCLKVRAGRGKIALPEWVACALDSPAVKEWLIRHAVGATMPNLNTSILSAVPLEVPGIAEQQEIVGLCFSLDDRIDLLRQTNATLESIAQALFKSWFIDFDPVRAKAEGREPDGMDAATAALFPSEFEESALGEIPKGWSVQPIGELVEAVGGSTPDTKNEAYWEPATHHWTSPKDLSGATAPVLLDTERKVSASGLAKISSGLLPVGTLLMSSRAPIGYLSLAQIPVAINQGYIAMLPGGRLSPTYLYFWCKLHMDAIKGRANGSTFMEISKKAFRPIPAVLPPREVIESFTGIADSVFRRLTANERQARELAEIRDTLLPRFISGKLRLPEAQEQIDEVCA